jgi:hypothetical protein
MAAAVTLELVKASAAASRAVGRRLLTQRVIHPFLGTPAVLHTASRRHPSPADAAQQPSRSEDSAAARRRQQTHEQQQLKRKPRRSGPLRRLCCLCLSAVRALPAAGVRAAVLGGAKRLAHIPCSATGVSGALVAGLALSLTGSGLRRWQGGRRWRRGALTMGGPAAATEVTVLSFNIRGVMDRWPERAPVLRQTLKAADADVVCFQEVLTGGWVSQGARCSGSGTPVCAVWSRA